MENPAATVSKSSCGVALRPGSLIPNVLSLWAGRLGREFGQAVLAAFMAACPGLYADARAQVVASDYMAYPKNMTMMDFMKRTDQLQLTMNRWPGLSADYKLGPGDEIEIKVFGASVMNQTAKVSKAGTIVVPLVGDLHASGLTSTELEEAVTIRLRDAQLIQEPQVLVYITGYESKQLFVFGAVDRPGLYQMTQQLRVMDAIFMAGGIDPNAGRYGYIHRKVSELGPDWPMPARLPVAAALNARTGNVRMASPKDVATVPAVREIVEHPDTAFPGTEVIRFDLEAARKGGIIEPNLVLKAGDIVVVSEATKSVFYVIGDVLKPAAIQLPEPSYRKILASQAIAWAGGPTRTAKVSEGVLIRVKDGQREEFKVDFLAILQGRQPDMEIHANDILFIPGSTSKTLAYGIMNTLPQTAVLGAIR